ncbi:MAG: tyrosine-type recombinase/integrase [Methylocystis sp.]
MKAAGARPTFLNAAQLAKMAKPRPEPFLLKDANLQGGYVEVLPSGTTSYRLFFRHEGAKRKLVIGRFTPDAGGLSAVRKKAREAQNLRTDGHDPAAEKAAQKTAQRAAREAAKATKKAPLTAAPDEVERVVDLFIALHAKPNTRDWRETERLLRRNVLDDAKNPAGKITHKGWKGRRLSEITRADVHALLDALAARAPIGANRTFAQLRKMCRWAEGRQIIERSPCEGVERPSKENPGRERELDDEELRIVWRAAGELGYPFGPIYRLLILTGQRVGEVAGMTWDEVDLAKGEWTIPDARSKNWRSHVVALTEPVKAILAGLPRFARARGEKDFLFSPGATPPSGFSRAKRRLEREVLKLLRDEDPNAPPLDEFVIHDLRHSVVSGMARLGVSLPVIERCVNHVSGSFGKIVSRYQHYTFAPEMRDAFTRWAAHIDGVVDPPAGKVVRLRA